MTLRERLIARNGRAENAFPVLDVPTAGRICPETVARIGDLAIAASQGDIAARDALYYSLQPRLDRISWVLRPWPNTPGMTGIWDRDDVQQESWIVFVELLEAWDRQVSFVPYLLARFAWRLRDRILRGIGRSLSRFGTIQIPESMLADVLLADQDEQPEAAVLANRVLQELIRRHTSGESTLAQVEAWLQVINAREAVALASVNDRRTHGAAGPARRVA